MFENLGRFDPLAGVESLRRDLFDAGMFHGLHGGTPTTDVFIKDESELVVEAHLPTFADTDITVSVDGRRLIIQAQRRERDEDKTRRYVLRESSTSLSRSLDLPEQAQVKQITAAFDDGVLRVSVPLQPGSGPQPIPITDGHSKN